MTDQIKIRFLGGLLGVSIISILVLGYYVWDLKSAREQTTSQVSGFSSQTLPQELSKDWDPWRDSWDSSGYFSDMQKHMDEMMNRMMPGGAIFRQHGFGLSVSAPEVSLEETAERYEVRVTIPEGQEVELNTNLAGDVLTISGKVKTISENNAHGLHGQGLSTSQFSQSLTLLEPVDEAAMTVETQDGLMTIRIPKL